MSQFFQKKNLKCINFHFKAPTKQILVILQTRLRGGTISVVSEIQWVLFSFFYVKLYLFKNWFRAEEGNNQNASTKFKSKEINELKECL